MREQLQKIIELAEEDRGSYALDRLSLIAELARAALEEIDDTLKTGTVQEDLL